MTSGTQIQRIYDLMKDGRWRTLNDISVATGIPVKSVTGRLCDLRKKIFGAHQIMRKPVARRLSAYQLVTRDAA